MSAQRTRKSRYRQSVTSPKPPLRLRTLQDAGQARFSAAEEDSGFGYCYPEETLVVDVRARMRPAQWVEHKLVVLLKSIWVPVSQVRSTTPTCSREHC